MNIGEKISNFLKDEGITQADLSSRTGIAPAKLSFVLSGKRRLSLEEYEIIITALELELGEFLVYRPNRIIRTK